MLELPSRESCSAGLVFAVFLSKPDGSINIELDAARANVGWMLLLGTSLAFLFAKPPGLRGRIATAIPPIGG